MNIKSMYSLDSLVAMAKQEFEAAKIHGKVTLDCQYRGAWVEVSDDGFGHVIVALVVDFMKPDGNVDTIRVAL